MANCLFKDTQAQELVIPSTYNDGKKRRKHGYITVEREILP